MIGTQSLAEAEILLDIYHDIFGESLAVMSHKTVSVCSTGTCQQGRMIVTKVEAEGKSVIWYCGGVCPVGDLGGSWTQEAPFVC